MPLPTLAMTSPALNRLLQISPGWSTKGWYFFSSVCSKYLQLDFQTSSWVPQVSLHVWPNSLTPNHCSDSTQCSHIDQPLAYWSRSQVLTLPYPLAFLCYLSSSATFTWWAWSLCPANQAPPWFRHKHLQSLALHFGTASPFDTRSSLLTGEPSASFRSLKTALFSLGLSQ